jgi:eukaryotic-like serine/threonine-protein kinase
MLEPGRMVTANVRLARLIGKGGMGSVWRAEHLALGAEVAVKFMSPAYVDTPSLVTRFTREATLAAQIKSPHVVQILDHGVLPEGVPFIVMELLRGEDLAHRIKRRGPLPPPEVAQIVFQVAKALSKAHHAGILHRDIKPDNIFLTEEDGGLYIKVLDFGVAKRLDDDSPTMTSTGSTVGTPYYMSPEQLFSAKHVDFQCDLWSLAVVAYRALTGKLPFQGDTLGAVSLAVHAAMFVPPSAHRPELPAVIDAWFARALCRDIAGRFPSVKELAESFARAAAEPGQTAPGVEFPSFPSFAPQMPSRASQPQVLLHAPKGASEPPPPSARLASPRPSLPALFAGGLALLCLGGALAFITGRARIASAPAPMRAVASQAAGAEASPASSAITDPPAASAPTASAPVASAPVMVAPVASDVAPIASASSSAASPIASAVPSSTAAPIKATTPAPFKPSSAVKRKDRDRGF